MAMNVSNVAPVQGMIRTPSYGQVDYHVKDDIKLKVTVMGAGSFGTALAVVAARAGHSVTLWCRNSQQAKDIQSTRKNPKRFKDFTFPTNITAEGDLKTACSGADLVIHCVPAQQTPKFLSENKDCIPMDAILVATSKGIVVETMELMSEAIERSLGRKEQKIAYLSGPTFAKEIILEHPMAATIASKDDAVGKRVQKALSSKFFRLYRTTDVIGLEVAGALKNPLAIGAGMADGLGFGASTIAALVTRGTVELRRLAVALGGRADTLSGLAGIGDLMLTCHSPLSRNRTFGYRLGQGMTVEQALEASGEIVEGYSTAKVAFALCKKHKLDMPLFTTMSAILEGKITPPSALEAIMQRELSSETEM